MTCPSGKNALVEVILEKAIAIHTLQVFRQKVGYFSKGNFSSYLTKLQILKIEEGLRLSYQVKLSRKDKIEKVLKNTIHLSEAEVEQLHKELQEANKAY